MLDLRTGPGNYPAYHHPGSEGRSNCIDGSTGGNMPARPSSPAGLLPAMRWAGLGLCAIPSRPVFVGVSVPRPYLGRRQGEACIHMNTCMYHSLQYNGKNGSELRRVLNVIASVRLHVLRRCRPAGAYILDTSCIQVAAYAVNIYQQPFTVETFSSSIMSEGCQCLPMSVGCKCLPMSVGCKCLPMPVGCQCLPMPVGCQCLPMAVGCQCLPMPVGCQCLPMAVGSQCAVVTEAKREITERPHAPSGVAASMSAHSKTPCSTPSMDYPSGNGVVWGRRGAAAGITL